jgi:hypothetical protein
MRKKIVTVSHLPYRLPGNPTKRLLLSRDTMRTLTSEELSQAVGAVVYQCPTGSSNPGDI